LSFGDLDTFPERNAARDVARSIFRFGVIPGGLRIPLAVDREVVIARRAFPPADRVRVARLQIVAPDGIDRKIHIAFDSLHGTRGRFGDDRAVPDGFGHGFSPVVSSST